MHPPNVDAGDGDTIGLVAICRTGDMEARTRFLHDGALNEVFKRLFLGDKAFHGVFYNLFFVPRNFVRVEFFTI